MPTSSSRTRKNNGFPKAQRLCLRKSIQALFQGGNGSKSVSAFPLRAVFEPLDASTPSEPALHVLLSVSKRHMRHATDRNHAKRQMREAWRLHRDILGNHHLNIAFIWLSDTPQPTTLVSRKMRNLMHRISESCSSSPSDSTSAASHH